MNRFKLLRAVDAIATADPAHRGYGYADTQNVWHQVPAIEQPRAAFHAWLEFVRATTRRASIVQIGAGRHGGSHLALQQVARRVVTVDHDAERLHALRRQTLFDADRSVLVHGDSTAAEVLTAVEAAAGDCDVLLLDGGDSYEQANRDWACYAPLVRDGGIVAIVDRSQAYPGDGRKVDVDHFVAGLERDYLQARGVRWLRHGQAHAIHSYVQTAATRREVSATAWSRQRRGTDTSLEVNLVGEFALHAWHKGHVAVPAAAGGFSARALHRNEYAVVLCAADEVALRRLVLAWVALSPRLASARHRLRAGDVGAAAAEAATVHAECAWFGASLVHCIEQAPWNHELLLALGTLWLFGQHPHQGAALLRRAFTCQVTNSELLQTVANAYLNVLHDEVGARSLLTTVKQSVRVQKVATVCHSHLRGHLLFDYPQLLASVYGVLEIGAHRGEHVAAWTQLEIKDQCLLEALPASFDELARACGQTQYGRVVALPFAVGAARGEGTLHYGENTAHASFLLAHALAQPTSADRQVHTQSVPMTTLDLLVAEGHLEPSRYNLLVVDTEGSELEVLRGAVDLLAHIDVICVSVFLQPVYQGAPMPQQISSFLRDVLVGSGFGLRAFEPSADPARGIAIFRRDQVRAERP